MTGEVLRVIRCRHASFYIFLYLGFLYEFCYDIWIWMLYTTNMTWLKLCTLEFYTFIGTSKLTTPSDVESVITLLSGSG